MIELVDMDIKILNNCILYVEEPKWKIEHIKKQREREKRTNQNFRVGKYTGQN